MWSREGGKSGSPKLARPPACDCRTLLSHQWGGSRAGLPGLKQKARLVSSPWWWLRTLGSTPAARVPRARSRGRGLSELPAVVPRIVLRLPPGCWRRRWGAQGGFVCRGVSCLVRDAWTRRVRLWWEGSQAMVSSGRARAGAHSHQHRRHGRLSGTAAWRPLVGSGFGGLAGWRASYLHRRGAVREQRGGEACVAGWAGRRLGGRLAANTSLRNGRAAGGVLLTRAKAAAAAKAARART